MEQEQLNILLVMAAYMLAVVGIGVYFARRANADSDRFFLGGRSLGPWVSAMSAEASDMSGWLLMGLPGVAYWCGLADAFWTAAGLAVGTYINWLIVSKRLRRYSIIAGNAITLPDFFSNRFHENKKVIMGISSAFILIFFTVYAASCLVTCGKLFSSLFDAPYALMMLVGAAFVLLYTLLGGFLAESASDFMQAIVMVVVLVGVLWLGTASAGGFKAVIENVSEFPGFLEFFGIASPVTENGVQLASNGVPSFGVRADYGALSVASMLAWGLGYFGMPQVLLRFMAIRREDELKRARRVAMVWVIISLAAAIFIGIVGRALFPTALTTAGDAENVFVHMARALLPASLAGLAMAGILAATISSSDSYLLIAASAFAKNMFQGIYKKNATDKQVMWLTRIMLVVITLVASLIALDEDSIIFTIVSFAWAGFGATFGPLVLFSLFWKRTTRQGAIAGMLTGGGMVFLWKLVIKPIGGIFGIYELLPAFIASCAAIIIVSMLTPAPNVDILLEFDKAAGKN